MSGIEVYGFGSYFSTKENFGDIDLLLVHCDRSKASCSLAIRCKHELQLVVPGAHITMLSRQAEIGFSFLMTANAKFLGAVDENFGCSEILKIALSIHGYR